MTRNVERSHSRDSDLALSALLRRAEGVRHMDLDVLQWCGTCGEFMFAAEAYAGGNPDRKEVTRTASVARAIGVPCYLLWLNYNETDSLVAVTPYAVLGDRGGARLCLGRMDEESFLEWLESRPCRCRPE